MVSRLEGCKSSWARSRVRIRSSERARKKLKGEGCLGNGSVKIFR